VEEEEEEKTSLSAERSLSRLSGRRRNPEDRLSGVDEEQREEGVVEGMINTMILVTISIVARKTIPFRRSAVEEGEAEEEERAADAAEELSTKRAGSAIPRCQRLKKLPK